MVGSYYKEDSKFIRKLITERINEGYTVQDFIIVINKKYNDWGDTEYDRYLRPETLFGEKFESYLNQPGISCDLDDCEQGSMNLDEIFDF